MLILLMAAGASLFFALSNKNPAPDMEKEGIQKDQKTALESEEKETGLSEMLDLAFPNEIPSPYNPCYSLEVGKGSNGEHGSAEDIQGNLGQMQHVIEKAKARSNDVLVNNELPLEIHRGDSAKRFVALTIDTGTGGPEGITQLLEIAEHYDISLTFFLTGCWVLENPILTQVIMAGGHSIGNHSLTHLNLSGASEAAVQREIGETDRILEEVAGFKPALFRKPQYAGGDRITNMAAEFNKISVQGYPDLGDTGGWHKDSTAESVFKRIKQNTEPGAIWVLHNLSLSDLNAFEDIVRFHLENGYDIVRVEDML